MTEQNINNDQKIILCVAVWGEDFLRNFIEFSLNSLMSAGNIPYLSSQGNVAFVFYSDRHGIETLKVSNVLVELKKYAQVNFAEIKGKKILGNYRTMNDCHRDFIKRNQDATLFFICPDTVFSENALGYIF